MNSEYDCLDLYPGADAGGDATGCSGTTNACAAANLLNILSGEGEGYVSTETVRVSADQSSEELLGFDCRARGGTPEAGGGEAAEPVVITVSLSDFQAMPVEPLVASAGPDDGWLPVHMVNVLHTDDEMQSLATEVLGVPVEVRAVPVSFHWDLGDGSTITTSTAGAPYPSEEITAEYAFEGWYDVTLTTTFSGQFSVAGGEWQDIDGTIEVASDPVPIYSKSLESRLVDGAVPVDEEGDPWVPERTAETEGPQDPDATHREIRARCAGETVLRGWGLTAAAGARMQLRPRPARAGVIEYGAAPAGTVRSRRRCPRRASTARVVSRTAPSPRGPRSG